jgi:amidase
MSIEAATDLLARPPSELAALVREGQLTARELVQLSLERIDALNPRVNAFATVDSERALAAADEIGPGDGRAFAGVPIATKDLFPVSGLRLTMGAHLFGEFTPQHDAFFVRRLKEAGFVIVGHTNTPEAGILPVTEPRRFGPSRNPWHEGRTPGGSSGGAAVAVASGMVPVAQGSDGGGSIRIPAACCGLVGLKPSRGRISLGPDVGDHYTTVLGALTRTAADAAEMLDVLAGYEPGDATWAPPPAEPFTDQAARDPGRLRIATTARPPIDAEVDPVCAGAVADAAELLGSLGHEVEEIEPAWQEVPNLLHLFSVVFGASIAMVVGMGGLLAGRVPAEEDVEPLTWHLYERAREVDSVQYRLALTQLQAVARGIVASLSPYDAVLTPSLAERPVPIGEIDSTGPDPAATFARSGRFTPFTAIANVTGQPAVSLPLFHGEDGLPLGVQLIGPPAADGLLLSLAAQLEAARPWADRRPDLA